MNYSKNYKKEQQSLLKRFSIIKKSIINLSLMLRMIILNYLLITIKVAAQKIFYFHMKLTLLMKKKFIQ